MVKKLTSSNQVLAKSEIRRHYFLESYTIIAPNRKHRPGSLEDYKLPHKSHPQNCYFCNPTDPAIWQSPRGKEWHVKVIKNGYPALTLDNPDAFGVQEIVINTPDHTTEFSELPLRHILEIFSAYRQRLIELKSSSDLRYVLIFKNDGPLAGATVDHAHCQILGLPMVPPAIELESDALNHYWDKHKSCAYCDVIKWELAQKVRIIWQDKHFVAIAPYASQFAYEVWLIPYRHVTTFADLRVGEMESLAIILKKITLTLDTASISFNYFLQESLLNQEHHFALKVEPRTTKWAGAELSTGVIINPVSPEATALWYKHHSSTD